MLLLPNGDGCVIGPLLLPNGDGVGAGLLLPPKGFAVALLFPPNGEAVAPNGVGFAAELLRVPKGEEVVTELPNPVVEEGLVPNGEVVCMLLFEDPKGDCPSPALLDCEAKGLGLDDGPKGFSGVLLIAEVDPNELVETLVDVPLCLPNGLGAGAAPKVPPPNEVLPAFPVPWLSWSSSEPIVPPNTEPSECFFDSAEAP